MRVFDPAKLAAWCDGTWHGLPGSPITGFNHDTRTLKPGDIYVAIRGDQFDGHRFVAQAFEKGAVAALVEPEFEGENRALLTVKDTRRALLDLAREYRRTWQGAVFGITGSVGKTTTKELLADVLSLRGLCERTRGNWNNEIGLPLCMLNAAPDALSYVFELGMNHPGEIGLLTSTLEPDWGVMTTVGPVHLEHFESEADIAREKRSLFEGVKTSGRAVLASDEPHYELLRAAGKEPHITVALNGAADYAVTRREGANFWVSERKTGKTFGYQSPLPGEHMVRNSLRAIAVGRELGLDPAEIAAKIAGYRSLSMRWEKTECRGVTFINDAYNANPISMRAAMRGFMETACVGNRWIVLGGMRELGATEAALHGAVGEFAAGLAVEHILFVGSFAKMLASGLAESDRILCAETTKKAAEVLRAQALPGDTILLKASRGEHLEQIIDFFEGE
jgi:UDP-N-acetylmuramoyl-tripeptide--D-alanyl-D-alanine ligase